jgi:hypothetical protein
MLTRASIALTFFLLAVPQMAACGGSSEYAIVGSARAAGADGTIEVEEIEGGNRLVTVTMAHLPPPSRLGEGLTTYMVWFIPKGQQPIKAGALGYDEDSREGTMMATSPHSDAFKVRITAEKTPQVAAPSDVTVAQRQVK